MGISVSSVRRILLRPLPRLSSITTVATPWWMQRLIFTTTAGTFTIDWDLTIGGGSRLMTGVYIYRIQVEGNGGLSATYTNKLIIQSNN